MRIYGGKLRFKKATKKMAVYGNDRLHAQYVPKSLLKEAGLAGNPPELTFVIKSPERVSSINDHSDIRAIEAAPHEREQVQVPELSFPACG